MASKLERLERLERRLGHKKPRPPRLVVAFAGNNSESSELFALEESAHACTPPLRTWRRQEGESEAAFVTRAAAGAVPGAVLVSV
jgi:hypothetical protein